MDELLQILIIGLSFGAAYALLALSINVIYSSSLIPNFAQGEFMMVGGILGWAYYRVMGLPYVAVVLLVALTVGLLGLLEYLLVIGPLRRRGSALVVIIIATVGVSFVVRIGTALWAGGVSRPADPPLGHEVWRILGVAVLPQSALILGAAVVLLGVLWLVYTRTTFGLALRASAYDEEGAALQGIAVSRVVAGTFTAGAALAGIAGLLLTPLSFASPWQGLTYSVEGFIAAIFGGLGSWPGAILGGALLGLMRTSLVRFVSPEWGQTLLFLFMLLVLYVRPTGLFGERKELVERAL